MSTDIHGSATRENRSAGEATPDKGLLEVNLGDGAVRWANVFFLSKTGFKLEQLSTMTLFDISPPQFHEQIRDFLADNKQGKTRKHSVWPVRSADNRVVWWYVYQTTTANPVQWLHSEHIQDTDNSGPGFAFMRMHMDSFNSQAEIGERLEDLDNWVHNQVDRIDGEIDGVQRSINSLSTKVDHAASAATHAAQAAIDSRNASVALQTELGQQFKRFEDSQAEHTSEILKLISTDVLHDRRFEAFESHVRATTDIAVKTISAQADKAGQGLSRKVTVPVSVIAAAATIIQWVVLNWDKVTGFFK